MTTEGEAAPSKFLLLEYVHQYAIFSASNEGLSFHNGL